MKILYVVMQGLALYFILFNAVFFISPKLWKWVNGWKNDGPAFIFRFFLAGLDVFGAVAAGFMLDFARSSGQWYAVPAGITKILFEIMLPVVVVLKTNGNRKVKEYIENRFRLDLFLLFGAELGFGCAVSFILNYWVKTGLI